MGSSKIASRNKAKMQPRDSAESCTVRPSAVRPQKKVSSQIEAEKGDPASEPDFSKSAQFSMDLRLESVAFCVPSFYASF